MISTAERIDRNRVLRDVNIVTVSELSQDFLYPEKICIKNPKDRKAPLDIGSFAYIDREDCLPPTVTNPNLKEAEKIIKVNESSLSINRREFIINFIDYIFVSGFKYASVNQKVKLTRKIVNWCDSNGHTEVFNSPQKTREAYEAYVSHLNHLISLNDKEKKIEPRTANEVQNHFKTLIKIHFGAKLQQEIISEIPVIKFKKEEVDAPEQENVRLVLRTALHLARGFKDLILNNKSFPYLLKMPDYECYVFPNNGYAFTTPYFRNELQIYNYEEGRVSTFEEYKLKRKGEIKDYEAKRNVADSQNKLNKINADSRHYMRLSYATYAMQAYTQLFFMITGVNTSDVLNFEYQKDFEYERDLFKNDFKNIKLRASGRVVSYSIGGQFGYKIFKEYLELRRWVLDGAEFKYLFFKIAKNGKFLNDYKQLNLIDVHRFHRKASGNFYNKQVKNLSPTKIRKYKDLVLNELKQSPKDIADSLNHSTSTAATSYGATSPDRHRKELESYWSAAKKAREIIKIKLSESTDDDSITVGHCDNLGHPVVSEVNGEIPVKADCKSQYGCLYCEHYSCHADEEDVHKLLSLSYVVDEVRKYGTNISHVESLFKDLAIRIEYIVGEINKKSDTHSELVNKVRKKVFDLGELTPFWERRLQQYEKMGVIA